MNSVIKGCTFEAHDCGTDACAIRVVGRETPYGMACGHCGEVVYPEFWLIQNHTFSCDTYGTATWYSSDLEAVTHRCNQPSALIDVERFLDLTVSA